MLQCHQLRFKCLGRLLRKANEYIWDIRQGGRSMRNDTVSFEMYQRAKFNYTDY